MYETVEIFFVCPTISPTAFPVSQIKHLALMLLPSPTTTMRFDSGSQSRSEMNPENAGTYGERVVVVVRAEARLSAPNT